MTKHRRETPKIAGRPWERHRRGAHAVLLCPGRRVLNVRERCPYTVIIAEPGQHVQEEQAAKAAAQHWEEYHEGTWSDEFRLTTHGERRLDTSGLIVP